MVPLVVENITQANTSAPVYQKSNMSLSGNPMPRKVRVLGHSVGGSVASYVAMLLDGK